MVEFENLPPKSRALILATLGLEIASENCASIFDLARKRYQTVPDVWRDVCKKTGQPRCSMPPRVLGADHAAAAPAAEPQKTTAPSGSAMAGVTAKPPVSTGASTNVSVFVDAPAPAKTAGPAATAARTANGAPTMNAAPAAHATLAKPHRPASNRNWVLAAGIAAVLLLGIGIAMFAIPRSTENARPTSPTTVTRANEAARPGGDKSNFDAYNVPPPEGTTRRLDAIKGSFSKQR